MLNGNIIIYRNLSNQDNLEIIITDESSKLKFLKIDISKENFTNMLLFPSHIPIKFELKKSEIIGKKKVYEDRIVELDGDYWYKPEIVKLLEENFQEFGWILDTYLGSQDAVRSNNGKTIVKYGVYKYVENKDDEGVVS